MEKQELDRRLEEIRNAHCSYPDCKKEQFMSVSIPYGFFTESGELSFPLNDKEGGGASLIVPLCAYHFPFAQRGVICMTDNGMVFPNFKGFTDVKTGEQEEMENMKDEELDEFIKELQKKVRLTRGKDKNVFKNWENIFQAVKEGRQFGKEIQKGGLNSSQP